MTIITLINLLGGIFAIGAQIFIILSVAYLLFFRKRYNAIAGLFSKNAAFFSFLVALASTLGSLFYSNVAGFIPCELCWFQRIFMYPLVVILGIALLKKDENVTIYSFWLSIIGLMVSIYQNYEIYAAPQQTFCSALSLSSCSTNYVLEFGYVTIPMMAGTAFLAIAILSLYKILNGK